MNVDLYALLRVPPEADPRDIKKAYFGLVRQYPPETHAEEFQRIREAYETLSNAEARKAYDAARVQQASAGLREELVAIMRDAIAAMESREYERAIPLLTGVLNENAAAEEARARICACLLNLGRFDEALRHGREFAKHHPALSQAELFSGYAARGLKHFTDARGHFVRASELDPLDFRPIRAVVDVDFQREKPEAALYFLEERLKTAAESIRLTLQLERVSVLFAIKRVPEGNAALDALEKDATAEAREELSWFFEREAASFFARRDPWTAERLLERLVKLQPHRASTVELTRERSFPAAALPKESLEWLEGQPKAPWMLYIPRYGSGFGALICLIAFGGLAITSLVLFHGQTHWDTGAQVAAAIFCAGFAGWSAIAFPAWWRAMGTRLKNALVVHDLGFLELNDDVVRVLPFTRLTDTHAVHHHTNNGYTHTAFTLTFGTTVISFSIHSHTRAEEFANNLHQLRMRMLDLMHNGVLVGERSVEFFPTAEQAKAMPSPKRMTWPLAVAGAAVGVVLSLVAGQLSGRTADRLDQARAMANGNPTAMRAFLSTSSGTESEAVRARLLSLREEVIRRLGVDAPVLAEAMRAGGEKDPLVVRLAWKRELDISNAGTAAVAENIREVRRREERVQAELQRRADALVGPGWLKFTSEPAEQSQLELSLDYRLELTTKRYRLKTAERSSANEWAAPLLTANVKWNDQNAQFVADPGQSFKLTEPMVALLATGRPNAGADALLDATWQALTDQTANLVGLRAL